MFMKKLLRIPLLLVALLLSSIPISAHDFEVDGIYYNYLDETAKTVIVTYKGRYSGEYSNEYTGSVTIPSSVTYNGVTYSVTEIGDDALEYCTGLTSVTIPNSVTKIRDSAFYDCTGLTSVTIGNSVTTIGGGAFSRCIKLKQVNITDLSAWYMIDFGSSNANPIYYAQKLILNGEEVKDLVIPTDITELKKYSFYGCTGLTSVTIPNSVTKIGDYAFYGCSGLTSVIIPNSVISISKRAFLDCTNLKEILAEEGNPVYFSYDGVLYINTHGKKDLHIFPPTLTEYVAPSFLKELTIPNVKSIIISSEGSNLKSVKVDDCSLLENLEIKEPLDTVKFNGEKLSDAVNLKKLILPKKININAIRLYTQNRYTYTFHSLEFLQIPNLNIFGYFVDIDYRFGYNYTHENGTPYGSYIKETSEIRYYKSSLYLPSSLKKLILTDQSDFYNEQKNSWYTFNNTLKDGFEIELLKPVSNLENTTIFQNSAIAKIALNVTEIPVELFAGCANLKSLTLPFAGAGTAQTTSNFCELFGTESNSNMRAVTQFFEDGTNKTYYLPTGLEELVLTEGCEMIPYGGLYNCNMLKKLTLPTTLFMVGEKALYGCAKMTDIYCKGADPAVAYDNSFDGMRLTSCKLHVPYNTSDRYKMSTGWEKFYYVEEEAPLMVSVAKSIENAGVVYGINEYQPGQIAEMEAVAHSGYTFEGWYEAGVLLTTDSKYTFTVIDSHNLVASFLPVLDENEVTVTPKAEDVTLSWASVTDAYSYVVEIFEDADMVVSAGIVTIDQAGQVVPMSSSVTTTITNLTSTYDYYYKVTAFNVENVVLSQFTGSFTTLESGIEDVEYDNDINYSILPGLLNIDGYGHVLVADIKGNILYNGDVEGNLILNIEKGIYILKSEANVYKIAIK